MVSIQPEELSNDRGQQGKLEAMYATIPKHERVVLQGKLVDTRLDMGWRERSQKTTRWYRRLYGDAPLGLSRLSVWAVDAMFRYPGSDVASSGALDALAPAAVCKAFNTVANSQGMTDVCELLMEGLLDDLAMRTTCAAWFDKGDGRRRVYAVPAEAWSPDDLLEALSSWARQAPSVARAMIDLMRSVCALEMGSAAMDDQRRMQATQATESLMRAIS